MMLKSILNSLGALFFGYRIKPDDCATRFPVLLVHGIAYRDDMVVSAWGRVPEYLRKGGCLVYQAQTDAWASFVHNAKLIGSAVAQMRAETGVAKVNIIAHSKGGIDARYAICAGGLREQVASLTTICSPHRGTCIAERVLRALPGQTPYALVDCLGRIMGDSKPQAMQAVKELTREAMQVFNQQCPNQDNIYYQSYGVLMHSPANDPLFAATFPVLEQEEGRNDGMISLDSYQWGDYQGEVRTALPGCGISHLQITGSVSNVIAGVNIPMLYVQWVSRLKSLGY